MVEWFVVGPSACPSNDIPRNPIKAMTAVLHTFTFFDALSPSHPLQVRYDILYW